MWRIWGPGIALQGGMWRTHQESGHGGRERKGDCGTRTEGRNQPCTHSLSPWGWREEVAGKSVPETAHRKCCVGEWSGGKRKSWDSVLISGLRAGRVGNLKVATSGEGTDRKKQVPSG